MTTRLTIRFDFDGERRLGPGKIALLEAIARTGSISAAGRAHKMSYRRAWLLVEELNHLFGQPLVTARPGGLKGGGAALTSAGERIVALYREAEAKMRRSAAQEIAHLESALATERGAPGRLRCFSPPCSCGEGNSPPTRPFDSRRRRFRDSFSVLSDFKELRGGKFPRRPPRASIRQLWPRRRRGSLGLGWRDFFDSLAMGHRDGELR